MVVPQNMFVSTVSYLQQQSASPLSFFAFASAMPMSYEGKHLRFLRDATQWVRYVFTLVLVLTVPFGFVGTFGFTWCIICQVHSTRIVRMKHLRRRMRGRLSGG